MQVEFKISDETMIVSLFGEMDHYSTAKIREDIDKNYEVFRCKHMIFNMSGVSFADSSGIAVIMGRYKRVTSNGGKVIICGCDRAIRRIFEMAGIYTIIGEAENENSALKDISEGVVSHDE